MGGSPGRAQGRQRGGLRLERGGGRMSGLLRGLVRERACRGGAEGEARSAVLYWGSLTVPRAEAAGTRGRGVPGDGAWHWDVRAPDTVGTPPTGGARALSFGASHPAPSPWVELGSTQGVVWCGVVWCGVVWCGVVWCGVVWCGVVWCGVVWCGVVWCGVVWCGVVWCGVVWCGVVWCGVVWCGVVWCGVVWCGVPKALLQEGNGRDVYPRVQVNRRAVCLSAHCVPVCCCAARPLHNHTWPVLLCRRLCRVTHGVIGPLHRVRCAAPSVLCVWCRTAWCCAPHCNVCALPHCICGQWAM